MSTLNKEQLEILHDFSIEELEERFEMTAPVQGGWVEIDL